MRKVVGGVVTLCILTIALALSAQVVRDSMPTHGRQAWDGDLRPSGKGWGEGRATTAASTSTNGIGYHGGPVLLGTTNVYVIWYGNWSNHPATQTILLNELSSIGGTRYFNINTTYYNAAESRVSNAVHYAGHASDNYSQGKYLNDATVQAVVSSALSLGLLPKDSKGLYFVLTTPDVHETTGFCSTYCGWHTHASILGSDIKFSFVGDPASQCPSSCEEQTSRSPNGDPGADAMANIIAHELEETVTDPDQNAWFDASGWENADKCVWTFGTTYTASNGSKYNVNWGGRQYLIQRNWVNAHGGYCAMSY